MAIGSLVCLPHCLSKSPSPSTSNPNHYHFRSPTKPPTTHKPSPRRNRKPQTRTHKHTTFNEKALFPLLTKNPHSIYKDIQTLVRQDKLKEALTILDYTDQRGIPINVTTFSALISACIRSKSLVYGKQVHTHIVINNLDTNEFLKKKLVNMYTACNSLEDAKVLFDDCDVKSVYTWNALLRGTVISGRKKYRDVVDVYTDMKRMGVDFNVYSFSNLIKSFAGASAFYQGLKAHAILIKNGFLDNPILRTSLIDMYCKCGKVRLACKVFDEMSDRDKDIVVWGAMIAGFAHNRLEREALGYFRWMMSEGLWPNSVLLTTILPVIGETRARKLGREIHAYVIKTRSYSKQLFIQSGLIDMYCKCGDMVSGRRVFYRSMERNAISWTALMSGYVSNGKLDQALRSVVWMQQEGFKPDVVTVATVVPICEELSDLRRGKEIHSFAVKNCFLPNVSITTSLIKMYAKCGVLDYAVKLFDTMESRNVISWTAMIDSYVENGCIDEAIHTFRSMQLSKHRPDSVTMSRILRLCSKIKALKLGKEIHGHILKKNFEAIPFVSSEIVKLYGACGLINPAKSVFDAIPVKGSMTWTAIIESYMYNKQWKKAIDLFDEMISRGFTPNHFTFKVVLSICNQAGLVDDAQQIFRLMTQTYSSMITEEHYSIIIGLLERCGHIDEAERLKQIKSLLTLEKMD